MGAGGGRSHPWYSQPQQRIPPRGGKPKNDIPSWARGSSPTNGETPIQYAQRVCQENGQKPGSGPGSNLNKLKKFAEEHFAPSGKEPTFIENFIHNFKQDPLDEGYDDPLPEAIY